MDSVIKSIIENLNQSEMPKKCDNCDKLYDSRKRKCTDCGGKVLNRDLSHTFEQPAGKSSTLPKYFNVGECSRDNPTDMTMGEPVLVNPNSTVNVNTVLGHTKYTYIAEKRQWVFVGADGPAYSLMCHLQRLAPKQFDWLAIVSGKGHLNMNQLKTLFQILYPIFIEPLGTDLLKFAIKSY